MPPAAATRRENKVDGLTAYLTHPIGPWTIWHLVVAFGFILAGFILRAILNSVVTHRLAAFAEKTKTEADDVATAAIVSPLGLVLPVIGIYLAGRTLLTRPEWVTTSDKVFMVVIILVVTWTFFKLADAASIFLNELAEKTDSKLDDQVVPLVRKASKIFLAVLAFILIAQNLGYSVSGLLAGLGIGGLALAMASKDTLANLFGSVMILIDRPFHVGDWITFPGGDGVVEEVGMRSTRVRTFAKTVVSIPNQALANATVENHSLMPKRRIKFTLGVTYESSVEQVRDLVRAMEEYLKGNPDIDQEFMLVKFTTFNDSSLDIFVYCFTVTTDWTKHLSVRQDVNLKIMSLVEDMGMGIAYPTRTLHLVDENELPVPAE
jgi:MscS family membrane protein